MSIDRQRLAAYKEIDRIDDLPTMQALAEEQTRKCADLVDEQCAANPLPDGYHYGPLEMRLSDGDGDNFIENLIRVTVYREVRKDKFNIAADE